jgi:hypothetical protein
MADDAPVKASAGRVAGRALLGFLIGAPVAGFCAAVVALTAGEIAGVSQREGAFAMGVIFTLAPLAALAGGLALAIVLARRASRG